MPKESIYKCPSCGGIMPSDYDVCGDCDGAYDYDYDYYCGFDAVGLCDDGSFYEDMQDRKRNSFAPTIADLLRKK